MYQPIPPAFLPESRCTLRRSGAWYRSRAPARRPAGALVAPRADLTPRRRIVRARLLSAYHMRPCASIASGRLRRNSEQTQMSQIPTTTRRAAMFGSAAAVLAGGVAAASPAMADTSNAELIAAL